MMSRVTKKGLYLDSANAKNFSLAIQREIGNKNIATIPKEIKNFIEDVKKDKRAAYSIEKTLKLKGILYSFLAIHDLKKADGIKEFIEFLESSDKYKNTAAQYFSELFDEIYVMLEKYTYREFGNTKIFFIDEVAKNEILKKKERLEKLVSSTYEKRYIKFSKIANFLNPEEMAYFYSIKYVSKYQYISKEESIKKYLPIHYEVLKNKINKEFRELFATHKFDATNKRVLEDKRDAKLKTMQEEYNYIMHCLEEGAEIDIKILSYEHAPMYPEITYRANNEKNKTRTKVAHLRSEVINILWYKPVQLKNNNTVADVLKNYHHAFGDVYYLRGDSK